MAALRSLLFGVFLVVTVVPWATVVLLVSIVQRGAPLYWMCAAWLGTAIWGARWICGVRYRVRGMQHLPTAGQRHDAVLLACKHQSAWETFALPALMPHPLAYVFKRELLFVPFFGWAMARLDMIHIDRGRRHEAWRRVAEQGGRLMAEGVWVIMFPEGTRMPRGTQGVYKTGASRLAVTTGVPIVPIAVSSARCWPPRSFVLRPGLVEVSIGAPIDPAGRDPAGLMREVEAWIEAEMRRIDPEAYPAAAAAVQATA